MTHPNTEMITAVLELATERVEESIEIVTEADLSDGFNGLARQKSHAREFRNQALALLSDAVEILNDSLEADDPRETNALEGVSELLKATSTYLEAVQDLLAEEHAYDTADALGEARGLLDQARQSVLIATGPKFANGEGDT